MYIYIYIYIYTYVHTCTHTIGACNQGSKEDVNCYCCDHAGTCIYAHYMNACQTMGAFINIFINISHWSVRC